MIADDRRNHVFNGEIPGLERELAGFRIIFGKSSLFSKLDNENR